jgi:hypothetical protein
VAEFDVSRADALRRFHDHQRALCYSFHAGDVLSSSGAEGLAVSAAYLPFWMFDAVVSVECKGTLGYQVDG